jgi:glutamine phosphoribosylpyrophosphate amidotransferase
VNSDLHYCLMIICCTEKKEKNCTFSETNVDILFQDNMLTSYFLELLSYEGLMVSFTQAQRDFLAEVISELAMVSNALQSGKSTTEILLNTKNIEILLSIQGELTNFSSVLSQLSNSSNTAATNTESTTILALITNFTTTLQSLGRMSILIATAFTVTIKILQGHS